MELQDAITIVKGGNLKSRNLFELWEVEQVLQKSGDTENLAKFRKEVTPDDMKAADAQATVEVSARQEELAKAKEAYVEDAAFKKGMDNFWNKVEIENEQDADTVDAVQLRSQIEDISAKEAEQAILEGKASAADYKTVLASRLSANCVQLVATSALLEMVAKGKKLSGAAAQSKATSIFEKMFSDESKEKVKINNKAAIGFLAAKMKSLADFGDRLATHTGLKAFAKQVKKTDDKLTKAYPTSYTMFKNLAGMGAIAVLTGGSGVAVYSAIRTGKMIQKQIESGKKHSKGFWGYMNENKEQWAVLGASVVSTAISFTGFSLSADSLGLVGQAFTPAVATDAAAQGAAAASTGFSFKGMWNAISNGKFLLRTAASTTASVAVASKELSKLYDMEVGSAERKAQANKVKKIILGSAAGTVLGLTIAGAVGGMHGEAEAASEHNTNTDTNTESAFKGQDQFNPAKIWDNSGHEMPANWKGIPYAPDQVHETTNTNVDGGTDTNAHTTTDGNNHHQSSEQTGVDAHATGDFSTSAQVQKFYEYRVSHINQYHPLVAAKLGEHGLSGQEVVNNMLGRAGNEEWVKLPDGCTPEHAVHTAVMAAQYKGDFQLAKMLNCPNDYTPEQIEKAFAAKLPIYNSQIGVAGGIGYPTDVKYDPNVPFGGSSHIDDCHKMYNSSHRTVVSHTQTTETETVTQDHTRTGGSETVAKSSVTTPIFEDRTVTTHENVQYDAAFKGNEYNAEGTTEHTLHYKTFGKENIHTGDAGVKDIYVERDGQRVEVHQPSDIHRGDKLKIVYEHGTESVPAKKFAGFDTTTTPHEYQSYNDAAVAAEAKELGLEPNKLTKLDNGDYVKVTKDGVVHIDTNVETGKAEVKLVDFDGKPMSAPVEVQNATVNSTVQELNETNTDKAVTTVEKVKVGEKVTTTSTESTTTTDQTTTKASSSASGQTIVKSSGSFNSSVRQALMRSGATK